MAHIEKEKVTDKYAEVVRMLSRYTMLKINIRNMEDEIKYLKEQDGVSGTSMDGVNIRPTNMFKSVTEKTALKNVKKIKQLNDRILKSKLEIDIMDRALEGLTCIERKIIISKYIEGLQWWQVSGIVRYSERHCKRIRTKAINELVVGIYGPKGGK